ncbi:MAG: methyltransferase [Planctomycetota bacterium]
MSPPRPAIPAALGPDPAGHTWSWRALPAPGRPDFGVYVHDDPDALLEALAADPEAREERLPYFASLWPAGAALARHLLEGPDLCGVAVLDLGCGSGVVGLAAACRGAAVTLLDRDERSAFGVAGSARVLGLESVTFVAGDWAAALPGRRFLRVLAADVLYEPAFAAALARALARLLAPEGEAWVADPGRRHADALDAEASCVGLAALSPVHLPGPGGIDVLLRRYRGAR